jgi:hypothetical protein
MGKAIKYLAQQHIRGKTCTTQTLHIIINIKKYLSIICTKDNININHNNHHKKKLVSLNNVARSEFVYQKYVYIKIIGICR